METKQQIDHLIELAIVQRAELKRLVEQLPALRSYLLEQINATIEDMEPQLRGDLIDFCDEKTSRKIEEIHAFFNGAKSDFKTKSDEFFVALEKGAQARFEELQREKQIALDFAEDARRNLAAAAEQEAAKIPAQVSQLVEKELARFPRAGEIDQLRKEFAEPRGLNPRGKWKSSETYQKLDLVAFNGDSYISNVNDNREKPSRISVSWTLSAARGQGAGGGGISSLNDLVGPPTSDLDVVGAEGSNYVRKTLTAGTNVTLTETPTSITISADDATSQILTATVTNAESVAITRGQVVYAYAAAGNRVSVKLAYNTSDATSAKTFGVVSDDSIAAGGVGTVTCIGVVDKLNLGTYAEGDTVYLSATPGAFTSTKPYAPNHLVYVGIVERANNGNGQLYVKIQNGYELDEIHDVQITAPVLSGSTLLYDATNSLWKNARLTGTANQVKVTNADNSVTLGLESQIAISGQSLTGSSATSLLDLSTTWNTTGNPTALKLNVTNTASGSTSNLLDLQVGGVSRFNITKDGRTIINRGTGSQDILFLGQDIYTTGNSGAAFNFDTTGNGTLLIYAQKSGSGSGTIRIASNGNGPVYIAGGGSTTTIGNKLVVSGTEASSSTSTGALVVSGGLGVAGTTWSSGQVVFGAGGGAYSSIRQTGASTYFGQEFLASGSRGYGLIIRSTTPDFVIAETTNGFSNYASYIRISIAASDGTVSLPTSIASTSTTSGSLVVSGGVGVAGAGYFGGTLNVSGVGGITLGTGVAGVLKAASDGDTSLQLFGSNTAFSGGYMLLNSASRSTEAGGVIFTHGNFNAAAPSSRFLVRYANNGAITEQLRIDSSGQVAALATTDSTSTGTGALVVSGGLGVAKNVYFGATSGTVAVFSNSTVTIGQSSGSTLGVSTFGTIDVQDSNDSTLRLWRSQNEHLTFAAARGGKTTANNQFQIDVVGPNASQTRPFIFRSSYDGGTTMRNNLVLLPFTTNSDSSVGQFKLQGGTITDISTAASGTNARLSNAVFEASTFAATNTGVTTTNASTVYISGGPNAGTNQTLTNSWGLWNVGKTRLDGLTKITDTTAATNTASGAVQIGSNIGLSGISGGASYFGGDVNVRKDIAGASSFVVDNRNSAGTEVIYFTEDGVNANYAYIGRVNSAGSPARQVRFGAGDAVSWNFVNGNVNISSTTASSSTSTGALVVSGGVGVAGAGYFGGNLTVSGTGTSTIIGPLALGNSSGRSGRIDFYQNTTQQWLLYLNPGDPVLRFYDPVNTVFALQLGGASGSGTMNVGYTTDSTSTTTGALVVSGGLGVAKSIYLGGTLNSYTGSILDTIILNKGSDADRSWLRWSQGYVNWRAGVGNSYNWELYYGASATPSAPGTAILSIATGGNATFSGNYLYLGGAGNFYLRATGSDNGLLRAAVFSADVQNNFYVRNSTGSSTYLSVDVTSAGQTSISCTTDSSSTTTGALVVSGGLGVAKTITAGGVIVNKAYTVATLPAAASYTYGTCAVSDATNAAGTGLGTSPTGGGSVKRMVYSDGSNWLLL